MNCPHFEKASNSIALAGKKYDSKKCSELTCTASGTNLYICLYCEYVGCSRNENCHALYHWINVLILLHLY